MKISKPSKSLELGWTKGKIRAIEYEHLGEPDDYNTIEKLKVSLTNPEVKEKTKDRVEIVFLNIREKQSKSGETYYTGTQSVASLALATGAVSLDQEQEFNSQDDFNPFIGSEILYFRFKKSGSIYSEVFRQRFINPDLGPDEIEEEKLEAEDRFDGYISFVENLNGGSGSGNSDPNFASPDDTLDSDDELNKAMDDIDDELPF